MSKAALIVNARSHEVSRKGSRLEDVARRREVPLVRFDALAAFEAQIADLLETGHDTFLIEGGDGTVLATLTACYNHAPRSFHALRFALLPGGSTNLAHEKLGLKHPDIERIEALITAVESGETPAGKVVTHPALVVERDTTDRSQVGFLLSSGSLARGMDHVQNHMFGEGSRGTPAILKSFLKLAARPRHYLAADGKPLLRPEHFKLEAPAAPIKTGAHTFSLASTLDSLSLGLSPFWGEGSGPIHFTYAPWPPEKLRRAILRSATHSNPQALESSGYRSLNTEALSMIVDGPLMLDGELLQLDQTSSVRIRTTEKVAWLR